RARRRRCASWECGAACRAGGRPAARSGGSRHRRGTRPAPWRPGASWSPRRHITLFRQMSEVSNTLNARSLMLSLLLRSPRMRGGRLVQWCGLFGIAEGTARVALSRMVERGELRSADGTYELAGRVRRRRSAQDWSIEPNLQRWSGEWRIAVVTSAAR